MIEQDIVKILAAINTDVETFVIESQNGIHPFDKIFCLIGEVDSYSNGTSSIPLNSRNEEWVLRQSITQDVRISIQGRKTDNISERVETLKMILDTPPVRQLFEDVGYNYVIDLQTIVIPVPLNTDQYIRHSFKVRFKSSKTTKFTAPTLDKVKDLTGTYTDKLGNVLGESKQDIP